MDAELAPPYPDSSKQAWRRQASKCSASGLDTWVDNFRGTLEILVLLC